VNVKVPLEILCEKKEKVAVKMLLCKMESVRECLLFVIVIVVLFLISLIVYCT